MGEAVTPGVVGVMFFSFAMPCSMLAWSVAAFSGDFSLGHTNVCSDEQDPRGGGSGLDVGRKVENKSEV